MFQSIKNRIYKGSF